MPQDDFLENLNQVVYDAQLPYALYNTATAENAKDRLYLVYRILTGRRARAEDNWIRVGEQQLTSRKLTRDIDHLLDFMDLGESPEALRQLGVAVREARDNAVEAYTESARQCAGRNLDNGERAYLRKVVPDTSTDSWTLLVYRLHQEGALTFGELPRAGKLSGWATAAAEGFSHGTWATVVVPTALHHSIIEDPVNAVLDGEPIEVSALDPADRLIVAENLARELAAGTERTTALGRALSA